MSSAAKLGVFLCAKSEVAKSLDYKRLFWAAETSANGQVFEVNCVSPKACASEIAALVKDNGIQMAIIGSYPLANGAEIFAHHLSQVGLDQDSILYLDLFQRPGEGDGCQPNQMAIQSLCQGLARFADREVPPVESMEVSNRVMVIGGSISALIAARDLSRAGYPVVMVKPDQDGPDLEALMGAKALELHTGLEKQLTGLDNLEIVSGASLISLSGAAGWFTARLKKAEGGYQSEELGAVIVAQGPPLSLNTGSLHLEAGGKIIPLSRVVKDPEGLEAARVGLMIGLGLESQPVTFRAALNTARRLAEGKDIRVPFFLGNTKVAAPDLEVLSRSARDEGVFFIRLTDRLPRVELDGTVKVDYFDEILGRQMNVELDALIIDESPRPDEAYLRQADALGLSLGPDGYYQPDKVNTLPTLTPRAGVYVVGPARSAGDMDIQIDEAEEAVLSVKKLLQQGSVEVIKDKLAIDRQACAVCLTCVRVCPEGAMGHQDSKPVVSPLACTGCGTCASECPMDAIQILGQEDDRYAKQIKAAASRSESGLDTSLGREILVFLCANSAARALSAARLAGSDWPAGVTFIEVPCASKIDPLFLLMAFNEGFDGVMVASCFEKACYSLEGNTWLQYRTIHTQKLLEEAGVDPRRLIRVSVAPNMSTELLSAVDELDQTLQDIGPTRLKAGARAKEFMDRFTWVTDQEFTILN